MYAIAGVALTLGVGRQCERSDHFIPSRRRQYRRRWASSLYVLELSLISSRLVKKLDRPVECDCTISGSGSAHAWPSCALRPTRGTMQGSTTFSSLF